MNSKFQYITKEEREQIIQQQLANDYILTSELNILEGNFLIFEEYREPEPTIEERLLEKDKQIEQLQTSMDNAVLELTMLIAMGGMPNV